MFSTVAARYTFIDESKAIKNFGICVVVLVGMQRSWNANKTIFWDECTIRELIILEGNSGQSD